MMFANLFFALREMGVTVAVLFMICLWLLVYACILLCMPVSRRDPLCHLCDCLRISTRSYLKTLSMVYLWKSRQEHHIVQNEPQ